MGGGRYCVLPVSRRLFSKLYSYVAVGKSYGPGATNLPQILGALKVFSSIRWVFSERIHRAEVLTAMSNDLRDARVLWNKMKYTKL